MKWTKQSQAQLQLEKQEPFTKRELRAFDKRERNFIRGIQFKDQCNKKEAIKEYRRYLEGNIKNRKRFRNQVNEAIRNTYPSGGRRFFNSETMKVIRVEKPRKPKKKPAESRKPRKKKIRPITKKRSKIYEIQGYSYNL